MLSSRAIATQGLGFGAKLTSVQGFAPAQTVVEPPFILPSRGAAVKPRVRRRQDRDDDVLLFLLK